MSLQAWDVHYMDWVRLQALESNLEKAGLSLAYHRPEVANSLGISKT